jgi:hypothetical protein
MLRSSAPAAPSRPLLRRLAVAALLLAPVAGRPARAADFDPRVITFGDARQEIKSTPMTQRPNRPLHVYGNTVRRRADRAAKPATAARR